MAPIILAVIVGLPLLSRLRGDYFSFGTLGMGMIVSVIFLNGGDITGGSEGKLLIKFMPEGVVFDLRTHYYVAFARGRVRDRGRVLHDHFQNRACSEGHPGRRGLRGVARHQRPQVQDHLLRGGGGLGGGRGQRLHATISFTPCR